LRGGHGLEGSLVERTATVLCENYDSVWHINLAVNYQPSAFSKFNYQQTQRAGLTADG
jgi:hypothetical protein